MRGVYGMTLTGETVVLSGGWVGGKSAVEATRTEYGFCGYSREGKRVPVVKDRPMNTFWGMDLFICGLLTVPPVAQSA
jgi:hypothetical protein